MNKNEKPYWELIEKRANKQCITCELCLPEIIDDVENEDYIYDYSNTKCVSHSGLVPYGKKLKEKQLMSSPNCWSLGFNEYVRIAKILEAEKIVERV